MSSFSRSFGRFMMAFVIVASVGVFAAANTKARAEGHSTINLRSGERGEDSHPEDEYSGFVMAYRVDAPSGSFFRLDADSAREAVIAFALRDEVATMCRQLVPTALISDIDERGGLMLSAVLEPV